MVLNRSGGAATDPTGALALFLLVCVAPHVAGAHAIRRPRAPRAYFFFGPALGGVFVGFGVFGSTPFTHCVLS